MVSETELLALAERCEVNAHRWVELAAVKSRNFVNEEVCEALDMAIAWQNRADVVRAAIRKAPTA